MKAYRKNAPRVGTLGDLQRDGNDVRLYCEGLGGCGRDVKLKIDELVAKHGAGLGLQAFLERCRCQCGARWPNVQLQISQRDAPGMGAPRTSAG